MFMSFLKEQTYTLSATTHNIIQKMTPKQTIHHFWEDNDAENFEESTSTEDHVSGYILKPARQ